MFDSEEIRKKYFLEDFDVEVFSLIEEVRIFFYIFNKFYLEDNDETIKTDLILKNKLETILNNLDFYLKDKQITKEHNFHDYVHKLIRTLFPDCQEFKNFQYVKKLKYYVPDIFIPECKSIVELKYVDSKEKFKICIESIDTDVKGYSGNIKYKYFYSVFYCNEVYYSKDEIEEIWKERNYPNEWKYYIVKKI